MVDDAKADAIEASLASKFVMNREGSAARTCVELLEVFVLDACALLNIDTSNDFEDIAEEARKSFDAEEALNDYANEMEEKLNEEGYTVVWNDGFVIYKDLSDEEAEYVSQW